MANQQDMTQANNTYSGFSVFIKWGTIAAVAATAVVVLIIA